jgi:hypothetical protein
MILEEGLSHIIEGRSRGIALNGMSSFVEVSTSDSFHKCTEESDLIDGGECFHEGIISPDLSQKLHPDIPAAIELGVCRQLNSLLLG